MSRNGKLEPMEVETMMNEARMLNNIIEVGERMIVSDKMEEARSKHDGREKAIISINPLLIHVPNWQRELRVSIAKKSDLNLALISGIYLRLCTRMINFMLLTVCTESLALILET